MEKQRLLKETADREKKLVSDWKEKAEYARNWKTKHMASNKLFMEDIAKIDDEAKRITLGGELEEDLASYESKRFQEIVQDRTNAEITSSLGNNLANYKWWLTKLEETKKVYWKIHQETVKILGEQKTKK